MDFSINKIVILLFISSCSITRQISRGAKVPPNDPQMARFGFGGLQTFRNIMRAVCDKKCTNMDPSTSFFAARIFCALKCPGRGPSIPPITTSSTVTTKQPGLISMKTTIELPVKKVTRETTRFEEPALTRTTTPTTKVHGPTRIIEIHGTTHPAPIEKTSVKIVTIEQPSVTSTSQRPVNINVNLRPIELNIRPIHVDQFSVTTTENPPFVNGLIPVLQNQANANNPNPQTQNQPPLLVNGPIPVLQNQANANNPNPQTQNQPPLLVNGPIPVPQNQVNSINNANPQTQNQPPIPVNGPILVPQNQANSNNPNPQAQNQPPVPGTGPINVPQNQANSNNPNPQAQNQPPVPGNGPINVPQNQTYGNNAIP